MIKTAVFLWNKVLFWRFYFEGFVQYFDLYRNQQIFSSQVFFLVCEQIYLKTFELFLFLLRRYRLCVFMILLCLFFCLFSVRLFSALIFFFFWPWFNFLRWFKTLRQLQFNVSAAASVLVFCLYEFVSVIFRLCSLDKVFFCNDEWFYGKMNLHFSDALIFG